MARFGRKESSNNSSNRNLSSNFWNVWTRLLKTASVLCIVLNLNAYQVEGANPGQEVICPWYSDQNVPEELRNDCVCAKNPPSSSQLSVQCHDIDGHQLVAMLSDAVEAQRVSISLLYLNASFITDDKGKIPEKAFRKLKLVSLQLSNCMIQSVHPNAFRGLENLKHLSLTQNQLVEVPSSSISNLNNLLLLDLSFNKITKVKAGAFQNLHKLSTLKLNDNGLELDNNAFTGLEKSLKNLNLKGTRLSSVPQAIANLSTLAFLDLAQNRLRELDKQQFANLHSLTALNLERNLLQSLPGSAFYGVNDTLSSLSLLNNLITHYPISALRSLKELRVLDLGFNLLTEIPSNAFNGLNSLTLLALDGNPLATIPEEAFRPINSTLRGISIGGRFLTCDCRISWIFEWIQEYDLQVTSRERNPQFCGSPAAFRSLNFQQINPEDLQCPKNDSSSDSSPQVPKEVTLLSIDTPMTVLEFDGTKSEDSSKDVNTETPAPETTKPPVTEYRNPTGNKTGFRFRRPRPRPRTTTAKPVFISSTERFTENGRLPVEPETPQVIVEVVSRENMDDFETAGDNNKEQDDSKEVESSSRVEQTIDKPNTNFNTNTRFVKPLPPEPEDISRPTSLPFSSTTRRYSPNSLKTLRSFHQSSRESAGRYTTSTATSISVSSVSSTSTMSSTNINVHDDVIKVPLIRAKPANAVTITPKPVIVNSRPGPTVVRNKASIDTKDFDDSKIPIISGVGPTRHSEGASGGNGNSNNNGNTLLSMIKTPPTSVQTQGVLVVQPSNGMPQAHSPNIGNPRNPSLIFAEKSDIIIRDIQRTNDAVMLRWESMKQLAGYRIIYRLFGEDAFRHGPPLAPTEREYRIKHIPFNECVVVCVVPYDDILYNEINPSSVPPGSQCRELKPTTPSVLMNHMDKITIGASAAICATVIIAVLLFIAITRRTKSKRSPSASTLVSKVPPSIMTPSPGPQGMHQGNMNLIKDWDQLSAVSARSIPRPRVYHGSLDHLAQAGEGRHPHHPPHRQSMIIAPSHRPGPDGHSTHRSYLSAHHHHHNHSMHSYGHHHNTTGGHGHGHEHHRSSGFLHREGRPIRASMLSVRSSHDILGNGKNTFQHGHPHTHSQRHFEQNHKRKRAGAGRPSQSESMNTLSGYDTPDNWTDHDMDVYVARNHARHDLVQL